MWPLPPQLDYNDFSSAAEAMEWVEEKTDPFLTPARPHKEHKTNWRLNEYYYIHHKGLTVEDKAELEDMIRRRGSDQASALALLSADSAPKGKKSNPEERFKAGVEKVKKGTSKLARLLNSCECQLPSFKRSLDAQQFQAIKKGMGMCRDLKESALDQLADYKSCPTEESELTLTLEALSTLQGQLSEHSDALSESMSKVASSNDDASVKSEHQPVAESAD